MRSTGRAIVKDLSIKHAHYGIINRGDLTLVHARVNDNAVGIINESGNVTVVDSTLADNHSEAIESRGATFFSPQCRRCATPRHGSVDVRRSTVSGNAAGIITGLGVALKVSQSTVIGNNAGILQNGVAVIDRSTVSGNLTSGLDNGFGVLRVTQSTVSGNVQAAIKTPSYSVTKLKSTIVANSPSGRNCDGPVVSLGHNLSDDRSCDLTATSDKQNKNPLLRPLGDYGGPTQTLALRPTSPAVDAGVASGIATDQRGLPRIVDYPRVPKPVGGDNSDIGAFELQLP